MSFQTQKEVKARKEHRCIWCLNSVQKGANHIKCSGVFDDSFYHYRLHKTCQKGLDKASKRYENHLFDYDQTVDNLREYARDEVDEFPELMKEREV